MRGRNETPPTNVIKFFSPSHDRERIIRPGDRLSATVARTSKLNKPPMPPAFVPRVRWLARRTARWNFITRTAERRNRTAGLAAAIPRSAPSASMRITPGTIGSPENARQKTPRRREKFSPARRNTRFQRQHLVDKNKRLTMRQPERNRILAHE